jgi:hypothetical protein
LEELFSDYEGAFVMKGSVYRWTDGVYYRIDVGEAQPIRQLLRGLSLVKKRQKSPRHSRMCKRAAIQQGCEQRSRGTPTVGSYYLAMLGEDIEALMFGVVWSVCRSIKLLPLPVFMSYKHSVNPIINTNPLSH